MDYWHIFLDIGWFLFLLLLLRHFWQDRQRLLESQGWLLTKGRITQLEWTRHGHSLWPKIEYAYQVNERDYIGEYLFLDTSHNSPHSQYSRQVAYRVAMAYKHNQDIDVYYNPSDPRQSVLDVAIPKKLNAILCLLLLLIFFHLGLVGYHWWSHSYFLPADIYRQVH